MKWIAKRWRNPSSRMTVASKHAPFHWMTFNFKNVVGGRAHVSFIGHFLYKRKAMPLSTQRCKRKEYKITKKKQFITYIFWHQLFHVHFFTRWTNSRPKRSSLNKIPKQIETHETSEERNEMITPPLQSIGRLHVNHFLLSTSYTITLPRTAKKPLPDVGAEKKRMK
jgi:hypothetical protein